TKMLAGPPAANTRRTGLGISTRRPAPSTIARRWAPAARGAASAAAAALTNHRRVSTSVFRHDDVGGLDDRVGGVALAQRHLLPRLDRDRGGHHGSSAHVDLHVGGRLAPDHLHHSSFEDIACAELHRRSFLSHRTPGGGGRKPRRASTAWPSRLSSSSRKSR